MTTLSKILTALIAGSVLAQPALAQAGRQQVSIEFRYQEWNSPEANYQRLNRLVKRTCEAPGEKLMTTRIAAAACTQEMTDLAVERLGRPAFSSVHLAETGRGAGFSLAAR